MNTTIWSRPLVIAACLVSGAAVVSTFAAPATTTAPMRPVAADVTPTVRVATYDVCATYCASDGLVAWNKGRADKVASSIKSLKPDVIGIQDAGTAADIAVLTKELGSSYTLSASFPSTEFAGVATYFRSSTLSPTSVEAGFGLKATKKADERGASYSGFKQKATGEVFTVLNLDATYRNTDPQQDTDRLTEAQTLLDRLADSSTSKARGRVLWTGNFNSYSITPREKGRTKVYDWITSRSYIDSLANATKKTDSVYNSYNHYTTQESKYRDSAHRSHVFVPDSMPVTAWMQRRSPKRSKTSTFESSHNMIAADLDLENTRSSTPPPPTTPPSTPPGSAKGLPASVLDLSDWKLTLPVGRPDEILTSALLRYVNETFFHLNKDKSGVVFNAPVGGATTSNSGYPRSELREMTSNGSKLASWSNTSGEHVMSVTQAITKVPVVKPHVVAGQIHDAEDDIVMIRLEGKRLFVESDGDDIGDLDTSYGLGEKFTIKMTATSSGIDISFNGVKKVHADAVGSGFYFKAGAYTQSNTSKGDKPDAAGEVVIYKLDVSHR